MREVKARCVRTQSEDAIDDVLSFLLLNALAASHSSSSCESGGLYISLFPMSLRADVDDGPVSVFPPERRNLSE